MPIAILIVGGYMIYVKMLSITIGTLLAFVRLCGGIYEPLSNLSNNLSAISRVIPPLERIQNILSLRHTEDVSQKLVLEKFNSIEYNNVTLGYDNTQILTINYLEIRKRDRILIKGQSGSGKSTLVLSMVGLLKPLRGKILLNGISVEQYDLRSVLSKVAIVGSEEMLFTGTVKENILLGEIYLENKLDKVLKLCQIDDLAPDTSVSSGGMNISHGQRQRVALARALIREPDVLILDEALSGVDRDREKKILKGILSEFPDITIIYISHRDAPFDFASKIVTINNGQAMFK
jgi:ABC-type bacteriocin/lantibiotic exporter with double-glycine peptidase domain